MQKNKSNEENKEIAMDRFYLKDEVRKKFLTSNIDPILVYVEMETGRVFGLFVCNNSGRLASMDFAFGATNEAMIELNKIWDYAKSQRALFEKENPSKNSRLHYLNNNIHPSEG